MSLADGQVLLLVVLTANPAEFGLLGAARHVVAAAVLLDGPATARTVARQVLVVVRQAVGLYDTLLPPGEIRSNI